MQKNAELIKKAQGELNRTIERLTVLNMLYPKARTNYEKMVLIKAAAELTRKKNLLNEKLMEYILSE